MLEDSNNKSTIIKSGINEDPVTLADLKVNQLIIRKINEKYKDINWTILSEENVKVEANYSEIKHDWVWVLDPLDGTKDFIQGTGNYAMHLALTFKKKSFLGVVLIPEKDELWIADGREVWCESIDGSKKSINIPKNALILGTGGASKAIKFALSELGIDFKTISRIKNNADYTYQEIDQHIIDKKLIINCSPVGTFPNINDSPKIPYKYLTSENFLYDLTYNPDKTLFLKKGDKIGCFTKNGIEMLKIQAERAWGIWNDISS